MTEQSLEPPYFIEFADKTPSRFMSVLRGVAGAPEDLLWQVRDSVSDIVPGPVWLCPQNTSVATLPDVLKANEVLIVSQKARGAIEPWLKDYEFIPTKLELFLPREGCDFGGGPVVEGYWWLNCWRRLDIVDWNKTDAPRYGPKNPKSKYVNSPLVAPTWRRLALKSSVGSDEHFFGLAGVEGERRYLSDALHAHLRGAGLRVAYEPRFFWPTFTPIAEAVRERLNK